jgi:tetratricopeptide (TPR) repeat protein
MTAKGAQDPQPSPESTTSNTMTGSVTGSVVQAGIVAGGLHLHSAPQPTPIPRQLPAAPGMFAGRHHELTQLSAALEGTSATVVISAIAGAGGIGKTWLALHWAHRHLEQFPDGQLFVDLRGFAPADKPMAPQTAVRGFLDAFGVDPGRIPPEVDAQVGLYRSLVAEKRMLIVLDNARNTAQVTALLPGTPTCTVLITSRDQLSGLATAHGAHRLALNVLDEHDSHDLLAQRLRQERMDAEPDAISELIEHSAGLPLALSIVASRASAHPDFPLATWAGELRNAATRLDALDADDPAASLSAVLSWSYDALTPEQAAVLGLLSLAPGPDVSLPAAVNLSGLSFTRTRAALRVLERSSLLQQHVPSRWQMHDLVRLYVIGRSQDDHQAEHTSAAALRRLVDFYLHTAHDADRLLNPRRPPIQIDPPIADYYPSALPDQAAAWAWFDAEYPCLLAGQHVARDHGWHDTVWQLTWALDTFHYRRGHLYERIAAWQTGLTAAQLDGAPTAIFTAHRLLGHACVRVGKYAEALDHLGQALTIARGLGDLLDQAHTHTFLVKAWGEYGDDQRALEHATNAQKLFHVLGHAVWEAQALNSMGWFAARLGEHALARAHCEAALLLCRQRHDHQGETDALNSLGYLAHLTGDCRQALEYYQQALSRYRDLGHTYYQADILDRLGQAHTALGHHDQARHAWLEALLLYQEQRRMDDIERVQLQLSDLADR